MVVTSGSVGFVPPRFSGVAAALRFASGETTFSIIEPVTVPRVERLRRYEERAGGIVPVTTREQIIQQRNAEEIENAFAQVNRNIAAVQSTLNLTLAALARATAIDEKIEVEGSYTDPAFVGSASSAGTVTIAAHNRVYAGTNSRSVAVDGGSVTGQSSGDYVTVFYRDAARSGGAVTYEATSSAIAQTDNIHIVWQGEIPASGEPSNTGTSPSGPGFTPPTTPDGSYVYE